MEQLRSFEMPLGYVLHDPDFVFESLLPGEASSASLEQQRRDCVPPNPKALQKCSTTSLLADPWQCQKATSLPTPGSSCQLQPVRMPTLVP